MLVIIYDLNHLFILLFRTPIEKEPGIQVNGFRPGQSVVNEFHNALDREGRNEEEEDLIGLFILLLLIEYIKYLNFFPYP